MSGHFAHPILLLPAGILALLALAFGVAAHLRPGLGVRVVGQRPLLQGLGMALVLAGLGLGLAGPRWGRPETPRLTVQVLLDASRSMNARDVKDQSRWESARALLDRLWQSPAPGLRYGLSLLTGDEIPLLPPGEDRTLLRESLDAVAPGAVGSPGTAFAKGILVAASQMDREEPAVLLLLSDGEETWEAQEPVLQRVRTYLQERRLPLYTVAFGGTEPVPVPPEQTLSKADPAFLARLAEAGGGQRLEPEQVAATLQALAAGHKPLPARRSLQPEHPEAGAWLALAGLLLWLAAAGRPLATWRPVLLLLVGATAVRLQAQDPRLKTQDLPLPPSVKAWLAQRALESGDLPGAQRWQPGSGKPHHALLSAAIWLRSGLPEEALRALEPLTGQGSPRPLPEWRPRALLLAARAQVEAGRPDQARQLLERLLLEAPGQLDALHDLQSLVKDPPPPPPPNPKKPPPPPPPRPSQGAQKDELEGLKQRLPKPPKTPAGVKDL